MAPLSPRGGRFTPFFSGGVGNTISDTHFFYRPFSTLGVVGHIEGGTSIQLIRMIRLGGSATQTFPAGSRRCSANSWRAAMSSIRPTGKAMAGSLRPKARRPEVRILRAIMALLRGWISIPPPAESQCLNVHGVYPGCPPAYKRQRHIPRSIRLPAL